MQPIWIKRLSGGLAVGLVIIGLIIFGWPRAIAVDLATIGARGNGECILCRSDFQ